MSVELGKLVAEVKQNIAFEELSGKRIAIDAYNTIYQFLSIIRQPDGSPLTDSKGNVTSHLSGLFYRTMSLIEFGILPIYVFDGIPPLLKRRTLEARMKRRAEAMEAWDKARAEGMLEEARVHAVASTKINKEVVEGSKTLLKCMGVPFIQAPSEGEAQAAHLVRSNLVYALTSQDYDSFLLGAPVVVRNFAISGKRKLPGKNVYVNIELERIFLRDFLEHFKISQRQLILLGMLMGTDFNSGIEKVGPKTALKIVREHESLENVIRYVMDKYGTVFDADPEKVLEMFERPEVREFGAEEFEDLLKAGTPDPKALVEFMCAEHGFSEERIGRAAGKLSEPIRPSGQKGMQGWM